MLGRKLKLGLVIPKAVCPELQNHVMNLELLPASLNRSPSDKVTDRAKVFAKELYEAKLLSDEGWTKVQGFSPGGLLTRKSKKEVAHILVFPVDRFGRRP